nr:MAG TPA: hypothetical protein [Caudoviricetes sp.]
MLSTKRETHGKPSTRRKVLEMTTREQLRRNMTAIVINKEGNTR